MKLDLGGEESPRRINIRGMAVVCKYDFLHQKINRCNFSSFPYQHD